MLHVSYMFEHSISVKYQYSRLKGLLTGCAGTGLNNSIKPAQLCRTLRNTPKIS